jgi:hypothetical protein
MEFEGVISPGIVWSINAMTIADNASIVMEPNVEMRGRWILPRKSNARAIMITVKNCKVVRREW